MGGSYDAIFAILLRCVQVEANGIKIAGVGAAYLNITRGQQSFRKRALIWRQNMK